MVHATRPFKEYTAPEFIGRGFWVFCSERRRYWSRAVTRRRNSLDIEHGVFAFRDPKRIARSLKRSAEQSTRRKAESYQSAMSMLNFYINRAGRNLPASRKKILARAKVELKSVFGRPNGP